MAPRSPCLPAYGLEDERGPTTDRCRCSEVDLLSLAHGPLQPSESRAQNVVPHRWWKRAFALCALIATFVSAGGSAGRAQGHDTVACEQAHTPQLSEAAAEARRYLAAGWLEVGQNLYVAYRMRSSAANPFDLTGSKNKGLNSKEVEDGYIWVAGLQCALTASGSEAVSVKFIAGAASFAEKNGSWTKPLRQQELTVINLTRRDARWVASEQRGDYSLLAAEDELRRPVSAEIPARNKRLGIPCAADQAWGGKRCVSAPRVEARRP